MHLKTLPHVATRPTPYPRGIRELSCLLLPGLELLGLTVRFDTQHRAGAAPWWATVFGYAPDVLHVGLASLQLFFQPQWEEVGRGPRTLTNSVIPQEAS